MTTVTLNHLLTYPLISFSSILFFCSSTIHWDHTQGWRFLFFNIYLDRIFWVFVFLCSWFGYWCGGVETELIDGGEQLCGGNIVGDSGGGDRLCPCRLLRAPTSSKTTLATLLASPNLFGWGSFFVFLGKIWSLIDFAWSWGWLLGNDSMAWFIVLIWRHNKI